MAIARITDIRGLVTLDGTSEEILKNRDEISDHGGILTINEFAKIIFEDAREVEITGPVSFNLDSSFFNEGTFEESITQISDLASLDYINNQLDETQIEEDLNDNIIDQNDITVNIDSEQLESTLGATDNNNDLQAVPTQVSVADTTADAPVDITPADPTPTDPTPEDPTPTDPIPETPVDVNEPLTLTVTPETALFVEDSTEAGDLVATSSATDPDGGDIKYSIDDTTNYAIDEDTGEVTLTEAGAKIVNDGGDLPNFNVTATSTSGQTSTNTVEANPADTIEKLSITIEAADVNGDKVYNAQELGTDGTVDATIKVPDDTQVGDKIKYTVDGGTAVEVEVTQDILDNGITVPINPESTISAVLIDTEGNISASSSATALKADVDASITVDIEVVENGTSFEYDSEGARNANKESYNNLDDALDGQNGNNHENGNLVYKNVNNTVWNIDGETDETFVVTGNSHNSTINLGAGDNVIVFEKNPGKNVNVNVGDGDDLLVLPGDLSDYDLSALNNNNGVFSGQIIGPANMSLTVNNIDTILFGDSNFIGDETLIPTTYNTLEISGTTADVEPGQTVTIDVQDEHGNTISTTAVVQSDGSYSTTIDGSSFTDVNISTNVSVSDKAGNTATASDSLVSDNSANDVITSIDVGSATDVMTEVEVVDANANDAEGIYEKDGKFYQTQETSQIDTAALRDLGYTIDEDGNFFKIDENAPKVVIEQEVTRDVTHVVDADPIMKVATETTTYETLGQEFTHDVGVVSTWHPTTINFDEPTRNIELDFKDFNRGNLKIEFLDENGNVIGTRTSFPAGDDARGYGIGEEFSSIRLTSHGSDIQVESVSGRGLPETVTVEAGGLVPDFEAMEEAGISWSSTDYQEIVQTDRITNIGDVGNAQVAGFNPEDTESSQVFDFGPDMANRLVNISVNLDVKGSWDNTRDWTDDYFSVSANGKEIDVNFYSNNGDASTYNRDDVTYIGWDEFENITYDYQVYLDENGQVQLDFMVASTDYRETIDINSIKATYEGETGWTKEVTESETYTETVLVDAPAEPVDPSEIPGGIPYVTQEVEVEPNMMTVEELVGHTYSVDISAALTDTDGSEALSVVITGVPEGATLSEGTDNGDGTWTITISEGDISIADTLTMIVPSGIDDFELGIEATSTEISNGDTNTADDSTMVDVPELVDTPTLDMSIGDLKIVGGSVGHSLEANGTFDFHNNSLVDNNDSSIVEFRNIHDAQVYMNGGDDTLTASNISSTHVNMGSGDDTLYVSEDFTNGTIDTSGYYSSGNDTIIIDGKFSHANINTGSGNDYVELGDLGNATINLGYGNDVLKLNGDSSDYYVVDNGYGNYRIVSGDFEIIDNGYAKWVTGGEYTDVTGAEAIVFGDGSYIGDSSLAQQYINASQTFEYDINLNAGLEDGSEAHLSNITLNHIPEGTSLLDSNGNEIQVNEDGSYTIITDENNDATVTLVSSNEISQDSLNNIDATVTASNGDDSLSVTVNTEGTIDTVENFTESDIDFDNLDLDFDNISSLLEQESGQSSEEDGHADHLHLDDMLHQDEGEDSLSNLLGETEEDQQAANTENNNSTPENSEPTAFDIINQQHEISNISQSVDGSEDTSSHDS